MAQRLNQQFQPGDRVIVKMAHRTTRVIGGWKRAKIKGTVVKVFTKTLRFKSDKYFYGYSHLVRLNQVEKLDE